MKYLRIVVIIIISMLIGLTALLFIKTHKTEEILNENISKTYLDQIKGITENIQSLFQKYIKNDVYMELKGNEQLRNYLKDSLSLTVVKPFKYVYVLYRDKDGKYRYLVDGSKEDRGEFGQKLDVNKDQWDRVYKEKKSFILKHNDTEFLYITYLKPLIVHRKVQGVIAIDLTTDFPKELQTLLLPLKKIFLLIFFAFSFLILILTYQFFLLIKTRRSSLTDSLTNTYNRAFLRIFLDEINSKEYSILMLDIDHFKNINDTYGHKAGDVVLREIAEVIRNLLREEDKFIRYGGEEFLIFVRNPQQKEDVVKIAERIRRVIEQKVIIVDDHNISVTISEGLVIHPERYKNVKEAIKKADELLYKAKREGRNKLIVDIYEDQKKRIDVDLPLIKEAIESSNIFCEYQPIIDIKTKRIVKYEALVRMRYRDGSIIYPGAFLDKIAFTTIYNSLTKRVLEVVFRDIQRFRVHISINLNFSDILDNVIFAIIKSEIEKNIDLASFLTIELLENEPLEHIEIIKTKLHELKKYGVSIAVDDFGSGYSNFAIFKSLPIDVLKIDGSLVREIESSKVSYSIVKSIASFSQEIGVKSIGEFVENKKILDILASLGIDYAQGFYVAKPGPIKRENFNIKD